LTEEKGREILEEVDRVNNSDYAMKQGQYFGFGNNYLVEVIKLVKEIPVTQALPRLTNCPRPFNRKKKKKQEVESLSGDEEVDIKELERKSPHTLKQKSSTNRGIDKLELLFEEEINKTEESSIKSEKKETPSRTKRSSLSGRRVDSKLCLPVESGKYPLVDLKNLHSFSGITFSVTAKLRQPKLPLRFETKEKYVEALITTVANDFIRKVKKQIQLLSKELSDSNPSGRVLPITELDIIPFKGSEKKAIHYYSLKVKGEKVDSEEGDIWVLLDADNPFEAIRKLSVYQDVTLCLTHSFDDGSIKISYISDRRPIEPGFAINLLNAAEYVQKIQMFIDFNKEKDSGFMNRLLHINEDDTKLRVAPLALGLDPNDTITRVETYSAKIGLTEEQAEVLVQCAKWFIDSKLGCLPTLLINGGFACGK
jgi:hypothetical protein